MEDPKVKKGTEFNHEKPEVPEGFICIDPEQKPMVLRALANFTEEVTGQALVHLRLCLHCREIAETMQKAYRSSAGLSVFRASLPKSIKDNCTNVVIAARLMTEADVWPKSN